MDMKKKQGNRCKVCNEIYEDLEIDHNHETHQVRGLVCKSCNFLIGTVEKRFNGIAACCLYLTYTDPLYQKFLWLGEEHE